MSSRTLYVKSTGNRIHETSRIYGTSIIGKNCTIMENVILGYPSNKILAELQSGEMVLERYPFVGTCIGDNAVVRSNSTFYCDVTVGDGLRTGHNVMVREMTRVGDNVLIGTNSVIDLSCEDRARTRSGRCAETSCCSSGSSLIRNR